MSVSISKKAKQCITCEYWNGLRRPTISKDSVELLGDRIGVCLGNIWHNKKVRSDNNSCPDWKLWGLLK